MFRGLLRVRAKHYTPLSPPQEGNFRSPVGDSRSQALFLGRPASLAGWRDQGV